MGSSVSWSSWAWSRPSSCAGARTTTSTRSSTTTASCTRSRRCGRTPGRGRTATASDERPGRRAAFPASAFRVSGSSTVRLTESGPARRPARPAAAGAQPRRAGDVRRRQRPSPVPATFMTGTEDRVMHSINHRPRRLGGPVAAVAAVLVLIVGADRDRAALEPARSTTGSPPRPRRTTPPRTATHDATGHHHATTTTTTTTTTAPPAVSAPTATSAHAATYTVAAPATRSAVGHDGECWIAATDTATARCSSPATSAPASRTRSPPPGR